MSLELQPLTEAGHKFVEVAEQHAEDFGTRADDHDRDGTFPNENIEAMKASGFTAACVPEEFGGWGMRSLHDLCVGLDRLGRGDGSTAIAINMHLASSWVVTGLRESATREGDDELVVALAFLLAMQGDGSIGLANTTEPGTDFLHPKVTATAVDDGWHLKGVKIFSTLSPVADVFFVTAGTPDGDTGNAIVFRDTPGMEILDDWDALGMRASGSHSITYDCVLPEGQFVVRGRWGEYSEGSLVIATAGNIGLLGVFLGIAEAARVIAVDTAQTRTKLPSGRPLAERRGVQDGVARMDVDLAVCRAGLDAIGRRLDALLLDPDHPATMDELHLLNAEFQAIKLVVNRKTIDVVDHAMTASGGAGYLAGNPLGRLYRDVRAGPFMQPFSPNEAHEYIGKVALGLDPRLEG